ncbi:hypothetical protein [Amycolatopsis sp. NPDC054798]
MEPRRAARPVLSVAIAAILTVAAAPAATASVVPYRPCREDESATVTEVRVPVVDDGRATFTIGQVNTVEIDLVPSANGNEDPLATIVGRYLGRIVYTEAMKLEEQTVSEGDKHTFTIPFTPKPSAPRDVPVVLSVRLAFLGGEGAYMGCAEFTSGFVAR